jgi:tetratricopeptide (TPR) repeat protein
MTRMFFYTIAVLQVMFLLIITVVQKQQNNALLSLAPLSNKAYAGNDSQIIEILQQIKHYNDKDDIKSTAEVLKRAYKFFINDNLSTKALKAELIKYFKDEIAIGTNAIAQNEHNIDGYLKAAKPMALSGDYFYAMELLTRGVIKNPESIKLWNMIGTLEWHRSKDKEALSVFKHILQLKPTSAEAHINVAKILYRTKDSAIKNLDKGLEHAQKSVSIDSDNADYLNALADILFLQGKKSEAISAIKKAIKIDPNETYFVAQLQRFEGKEIKFQ